MPESTLTIIFRGLMAFHRKEAGAGSIFEVGLLTPHDHHAPVHVPRINTYKNGVLDSVFFLEGLHPTHRQWQLNVEGALDPVSTDELGTFTRKTHTHETDYRWLIDLEDSNEFYGPLTGKINTKLLKPVLLVPNGKFYTRLRSGEALRQKEGVPGNEDFGRVSAAVGCDIRLQGTKAELVVKDTGVPIFTFEVDPSGRTLYEIANTPPDTHKPAAGEDHFQHYYEIFTASVPKFKFKPKSAPPGPSPALCGAIRLGQMTGEL
jgi:hypothetical protein